MRDFYIFFSVMTVVTGALAVLDQDANLASGKVILGLDLAHISFGAAAGIISVLAPKVQSA